MPKVTLAFCYEPFLHELVMAGMLRQSSTPKLCSSSTLLTLKTCDSLAAGSECLSGGKSIEQSHSWRAPLAARSGHLNP